MKMMYNLDIPGLLAGTFLDSSIEGLFGQAFDTAQQEWILSAIIMWPLHMLIAFLSSLLLIAGIVALAILIPLGIDVFTGPNAIQALAIPVGVAFFICWGIFPTLYIMRSSFINYGKRISRIFNGAPSS